MKAELLTWVRGWLIYLLSSERTIRSSQSMARSRAITAMLS